ncbi:MAG TPA: hypothetical protein VH593_07520 [Ktedonobacteraceae bacterium]
MQRRYRLPVNVILQTLTSQNGNTELSAALSFVPGHPHQAGEVLLVVGQGQVQRCTIQTRDGLTLSQGGEALKLLEQAGNLEWHVQGAPGGNGHVPSWPQEQATEEQRIPHRRVVLLSPVQQQTLSHRQRQVFALADGSRNVASIAALLHLSPDEVTRLLQALQHDQLID